MIKKTIYATYILQTDMHIGVWTEVKALCEHWVNIQEIHTQERPFCLHILFMAVWGLKNIYEADILVNRY